LKILRPLKSINALPGIRQHFQILVKSLPQIFNVVVFLFFIYILFSIIGMQQYGEAFYNRCRLTPQPLNSSFWEMDPNDDRPCSINGLGRLCSSNMTCGNPFDKGMSLENEGIEENSNIFNGVISFNNLGTSLLLIN